MSLAPEQRSRPQKGEARSAILKVADRVFYQHGIRGGAIDLIAAETGVTKRTIYYHFPTKQALVRAYLKARDESTQAWIGREAEKRGRSARDQILAVFDLLAEWFATPEYRGCPYLNAIVEATDDPEMIGEAVVAHKEAVAGWLAAKLEAAGAPDVPRLTAQLMLLVDGALIRAVIYRDGLIAPQAKAAAAVLLEKALPAEESS